jgi:regulator of protease activity HflC (stomatin/prohibitin superfamily)
MLTRVPADTAYVLERLGRYHRTLMAGMHVIAPFLDRIAFRHSLLTKFGELSDTATSLDNMNVHIASTFHWRIVDARKASYDIADPVEFVTAVIRAQQRQWIARYPWLDIRETTRQLESDVARAAGEATLRAGVEVVEINVESVDC